MRTTSFVPKALDFFVAFTRRRGKMGVSTPTLEDRAMKRLLPGVLAVALLTAAESEDPTKKDLERMQGDWAAESMIRDGQKFPDEDAQAYFRTIKDDGYTVFRFSKVAGQGRMKLDASKTPKTIDFTPAGGKIPPIAGIYALDGDTLTLCYALPGKPRPEKLASEPDSGNTLSVWKREKK
jgi:uncharacterized protein (TIGR03067 family)